MSILEIVCGTGGWTGPKPGDPDSSLLLRATPAFGGIDITISYPTTNPHALSHTILYRGLTPNFDAALRLTEFSGTFYHDRTDDIGPVTYYYWATTVSVNGTIGELLGPASAMARPRIDDYIQALTGKIDSGFLANALKTKIDRIDWLEDGITKVENYAKNSEEALARMITGVQASLGEATSLVLEEINVRSTENSSLAEHITTVQAQLGDEVASVEQYMGAYIIKTDGTIEGLGGSLSGLEEELLEGMGKMGTIYTAKVQAGDLIGGFGMVNDSKTIEAGFDVDKFWVGRTTNKKKPFIIEGGEVVIDQAVINKLTFNKLRDERGAFIVEDGQVKANYIDTKGLVIRDTRGNAVFSAGTGLSSDLVNGLGKLAKRDTVRFADTVGFGNLATKNTVTFADTTGFGSLATKNNVTSSDISGQLPNNKISGLGAMAIVDKITSSNSVTYITAGAIDMAMINNLVVTDAHISWAGINFAKINNVSIGSAHIQGLAVGRAHIQDLAVDTLKIAGNAVSSTVSGTGPFNFNPGPTGAHVIVFYKMARPARPTGYDLGTRSLSVGGISASSTLFRYGTAGGGDDTSYGYGTTTGVSQGWLGPGNYAVNPGGTPGNPHYLLPQVVILSLKR